MNLKIDPIIIGGTEVHPIIEGGKGIGVSNGQTAGAFAASGAVGTFSGVNADFYDENGKLIVAEYHGKTRKERHEELIAYGITGGITQAKIAHDISGGKGRIHMNVLWEMGGAEEILHGVLKATKGLISGVTCGAGMPYKIADIAAEYNIHYLPIVSSMRAFRALWKRSYHRYPDLLGAVVYEDPWLAGGHNGLSNSEDPLAPEDPYHRIVELRQYMNEVGLHRTPIVMAGGVWYLRDWANWFNNPEIGPIAFQFGTRPVVTTESPVSDAWKQKLLSLSEGDVFLNRFSPTGFYSSAVKNDFIQELQQRQEHQIAYSTTPDASKEAGLAIGARGRLIYVTPEDKANAENWIANGFTEGLRTPDSTIIFVTKSRADSILVDQINCMGCLSACKFSNWFEKDPYTTGKKADPRSFCIQKTLQNIVHSDDVENQLMFAGHNAYKFASDPFYQGGNFIPSTKQLVDRILTGD